MIHSPRPGFYDDIKKGFFELEQQYGFEAKSLDEYEVLLSNKKCIIDLEDTEDGLWIYILNPKSTEKQYWPNLIYECIEGKFKGQDLLNCFFATALMLSVLLGYRWFYRPSSLA